jgi:hypothetical protein
MPQKAGLKVVNFRLYSEGQIEALVRWLEQYGLFGAKEIRPEYIPDLHKRWAVETEKLLEQIKGGSREKISQKEAGEFKPADGRRSRVKKAN